MNDSLPPNIPPKPKEARSDRMMMKISAVADSSWVFRNHGTQAMREERTSRGEVRVAVAHSSERRPCAVGSAREELRSLRLSKTRCEGTSISRNRGYTLQSYGQDRDFPIHFGSFWRAIQIVFFAYAGMRLLEHFGATQIEAATWILVVSIFELGVLMNRTIGVVADSFRPKLGEASVLLGDLA